MSLVEPFSLAGGGSASAQEPASPVSFWSGSEVFAKGPLLLDRMAAAKYNVYAVRRDKPGAVELHTFDTDIIFVLEGSATFVTGGTVTDSRALSANESSGTGIRDGEARQVGHGDVIMVPNGTPHWFRDVSPTINYFAVKLRQAGTAPIPTSVRFWKGSEVFDGNGLLYDGKEGTYVRVYALRRDKPLGVELHSLDTDVVFVMGGAGTVVTGGAIADPRALGPTERAAAPSGTA